MNNKPIIIQFIKSDKFFIYVYVDIYDTYLQMANIYILLLFIELFLIDLYAAFP